MTSRPLGVRTASDMAIEHLCSLQLPDGSWPAQREGPPSVAAVFLACGCRKPCHLCDLGVFVDQAA